MMSFTPRSARRTRLRGKSVQNVSASALYLEVIAASRAQQQVADDFGLREIRLVMRMVVDAARGESPALHAERQAIEAALDIAHAGCAPVEGYAYGRRLLWRGVPCGVSSAFCSCAPKR